MSILNITRFYKRNYNTIIKRCFASPPFLPVRTIVFNFFIFAVIPACKIFLEFPEVVIPKRISPSFPYPIICCENISSAPISLIIVVISEVCAHKFIAGKDS